jgi:hypothetical protein
MSDFLQRGLDAIEKTHVFAQIKDVDAVGLFTNPWFLVPFVLLIGYLVFKQSWKDIVILLIFFAVWWVSGTDYMHSLIVGGEVQISKILPVIGVGVTALAIVIYLIFGRSD